MAGKLYYLKPRNAIDKRKKPRRSLGEAFLLTSDYWLLASYSATAISLSSFFSRLMPPICTRLSPLIPAFSITIS